MNRFQKIAVFIFRMFGMLVLLFGLGGFIYAVIASRSVGFQLQGMSSGAFYFIAGLALVLFSGPLGRLLGKGLDD